MTSGLMGRAVSLLAPLLIMPAMLEHLGSDLFGIWVTGTSILALAAFMDFGIGNSLLTRLAVQFGQSDLPGARRSIGAAFRILGIVAAVGLCLLAAAALAVLVWPDRSAGTILTMMLFFVVGLPLSVVYRILYADHRMVFYNVLQIATSACSVLFTFAAIAAGMAPLAVVAIYAAVPVLFMLATTLWYFATHPDHRPGRIDFQYGGEGRDLFRLGLGHLVLGILTAVGMNIDIPLILYTLGSEAVTDYALPSRIGMLLLVVVGTVFMPLWSVNGAAMARREFAWVRRNTFRMSVGGGLAIAALGTLMTLGIDLIMQLWVGQAFPDQRLVLATTTVAVTVIAVTSPYNMVLNAAGQVAVQVWAWGAFVAVSVAVKLVLMPLWGAWSVAVVTALAYLVCITPVILVSALRITSPQPGRRTPRGSG